MGLPVGQDASRLLANYVLVPTDDALDAFRCAWLRYQDDTWVFVRSEEEAYSARAEYEYALSGLRLSVNESKWEVTAGDQAERRVQRALGGYGDVFDDFDAPSNLVELDESDPRAMFDYAREAPYRRHRAMRRSLTLLGEADDPYPLTRMTEDSDVIGSAPEHSRRYLRQVGSGSRHRRGHVDLDWLVEIAETPRLEHHDAERLVALDVLSHGRRPSQRHAQVIGQLATHQAFPAVVRVAAIHASMNCEGFKSRHADAAMLDDTQELSVRRAAMATLRCFCDERRVEVAIQKAVACNSQLEPTARWLHA